MSRPAKSAAEPPEATMGPTGHRYARVSTALLSVTAMALVAVGLLYTDHRAAAIANVPSPRAAVLDAIATTRWTLLLSGAVIGLFVLTVRRARFFQSATLARFALLIGLFAAPLFAAEMVFRPFTKQTPMLFTADDELGWRLIPNAATTWGGVAVRINAHGLRGPELDYAKPAGRKRILFLGDSVTFGYRVGYDDTFVAHAQRLLRARGMPAEAINAGVGGYSPWQQGIYLRREGVRFDPDLVVVSFVLNDVVDYFSLPRFGGRTITSQLSRAGGTSLARHSGLAWFAYQLFGRARYGDDVAAGAAWQQNLTVRRTVLEPESPDVVKAWEVTSGHLEEIVTFCQDRRIPLLLVAFPYRFQLAMPEQRAPQQRLAAFAKRHRVPLVDLLPAMLSAGAKKGVQPSEFFVDYDHLSPLGGRVVASHLAAPLHRLLSAPGGN